MIKTQKLYLTLIVIFYREITTCLAKFIFKMGRHGETDWVLAIPLLHFLCKDSQPFQHIPCSYDYKHKTKDWWGTSKIDRLIGEFQLAMGDDM